MPESMATASDPEFTPISPGGVRARSQIRFKLLAKPQNPDQAVVLWEWNGERILTWASEAQEGRGVIEIVHEGDVPVDVISRHKVSVSGFLWNFEAQEGEVVPHHLLEPTPPDEKWARLG
jgi:hypothetical protein